MKHTKGKLTVKPSNSWPFDLVTFDENNTEVFRRSMPAFTTDDKSFDDCLNAVNWDYPEKDGVRQEQIIAYNDERLRAKAPEMLELLRDIVDAQYNSNRTLADLNSSVREARELIKELE